MSMFQDNKQAFSELWREEYMIITRPNYIRKK